MIQDLLYTRILISTAIIVRKATGRQLLSSSNSTNCWVPRSNIQGSIVTSTSANWSKTTCPGLLNFCRISFIKTILFSSGRLYHLSLESRSGRPIYSIVHGGYRSIGLYAKKMTRGAFSSLCIAQVRHLLCPLTLCAAERYVLHRAVQ